MDKLNSHLNPTMKKPYHPVIQAAMKLVRKKINHYYSMTNLSSAYWITMGNNQFFPLHPMLTLLLALHPGLKAKYFQQQGWEREWVDKVKNLVHEEYIAWYEGMNNIAVPASSTTDPVCFWFSFIVI